MFERLSHIMLFAKDVPAAAEWYRRTLGFEPLFIAGDGYASLMHKGMGVRLDLHMSEDGHPNIGKGPMPYFAVKDIEAALAALKAKGVECSEPRSEQGSPRFASFKDGCGNLLGVEEMGGH